MTRRKRVTLRRWRPSALSVCICLIALMSTLVGLYPSTASWLNSYQQSKVIAASLRALDDVDPGPDAQLRMANAYNKALVAGVDIKPGSTIPLGRGEGAERFSYRDVLNANADGLMGRIIIDKIDVDLPIYHGTDPETLEMGAGHLEGSHLPIGGVSTRAVITAHRGLANATMFTDLDQVEVGDTFTVSALGNVVTYRVRDTQVIDPDDTDTLRAEPNSDLVTLITCTPLGINSHRIVVTGERITPTPVGDLQAADSAPHLPGFPWWAVVGGLLGAAISGYLVRSGFVDARRSNARMKSGPTEDHELS